MVARGQAVESAMGSAADGTRVFSVVGGEYQTTVKLECGNGCTNKEIY